MPFFVTSLLSPLASLFPGKPPGYVELSLAAILALWLSGIAAYVWLRRSCGAAAATFGALVYLANPYHLTVDLYMRAAFAEFWGFAWMPLILYFTEGVVRKRRYATGGLAVSYALLVMTHLLTTVMFSPVPIAYALFLSNRGERLRNLARVAAGLTVGIGLAAVYLLPALDHQRYASAQRYLVDPVFQWQNNFPPLDARLIEKAGSWPSFVQFIAIVVLLSAAAVICLAGGASRFWLAIAGAALFMTLPLSAPLWRMVPILANLQFPWRYQTVVAVAMAALAALAWGKRWSFFSKSVMAVIVLLWLAFFGRMFYIISIQDLKVGWDTGFTDDPFLTAWAKRGATATPTEPVRFESGRGTAEIQRWAPRDIRVRVNSETESRIVFHQFYYPGWNAEASEQGHLRVTVPPGPREVRLRLDGGRMEVVGRWVSAVALLILLRILATDKHR